MSTFFVAISGNVEDLVGGEVTQFSLVAKPLKSYYNGSVLVAQAGVVFKAVSGAITGSIQETETTGQLVAFEAKYTAEGIYQNIEYQNVIIPNVESLNLADLLVPLPLS